MSEVKSILILGGSGFIGTYLVERLQNHGYTVRIGDLRQSQRFPELWVETDVRDRASVAAALQNMDCVINLAAEHRDDVRPIERYHQTNVGGAEEVCAAARLAGVQKLIFTSSVAVYGFQPRPSTEDGPYAPFNPYGETKLLAEKVYRDWAAEDEGRSLVIVRPTVVFGENNRGNVYNLLRQIASGRFLMVGSGRNQKSMAYVRNIVGFLEFTLGIGAGTHTYNYVDTPDLDTRTLVTTVNQAMGRERSTLRVPLFLAMAGAHLLDLFARITGRTFPISAIRIRKFTESTQVNGERLQGTGFKPEFTLSEGLARTVSNEFPDRKR
jgi:GlcNAc-P-P-Und epimerase